MPSSLSELRIAILIASGFDEHHMSEMQRELVKAKASTQTIAPENGVVHGWQGNSWGHYFPVNIQIGEALGSDFDALIIPGGERGTNKLKANPHARRIINHFLEAGKPVAAIGTGVNLLTLSPRIAGHEVAAPEASAPELTASGVVMSSESLVVSDHIITSNGSDIAAWVATSMEHLVQPDMEQVAA